MLWRLLNPLFCKTLQNSPMNILHRLLNCEIGGLDCHVIQTV